MKAPTLRDGHPRSVRRGDRTLRMTRSVPEIVQAYTTFEGEQQAYELSYDAWSAADREHSAVIEERNKSGLTLGDMFRGVGMAILVVDHGSRKSELYRRYFMKGYGAVLGLPPAEALVVSAGLLTALQNEPNEEIRARRDSLQAARDAYVTAAAKVQTTHEAAASARARLEEQAAIWRSAYNAFYFDVRKAFPRRRRWVESAFAALTKRTAAEEVPVESNGENASDGDGSPAVNAPVPATNPQSAPVSAPAGTS